MKERKYNEKRREMRRNGGVTEVNNGADGGIEREEEEGKEGKEGIRNGKRKEKEPDEKPGGK